MASAEILIQNADLIVTMDAGRHELKNADIRIRDHKIIEIGSGLETTGEVINAKGCVVTPGLVNTHHHLYQTLTRAVPGAQDALLFGWLQTLYPIWAGFSPTEMRVSAQVGLAELALSGCTLTSDHLYLFPNGSRIDDTIEAAQSIGMRFQPTRGAMSVGVSDGGLPPDSLVEKESAILEDCIRLIDTYHDASEGSMLRVGIAPCSPFSVSSELMADCANLARDKQVMLHTHLAENDEDIAYSLEKNSTSKKSSCFPTQAWASHIAHAPTVDWAVESRQCATCEMQASTSGWASMARPATMPET